MPEEEVCATDEQVDRVRELYCDSSDNIQVDYEAAISECDDGVWVQGWLWLSDKGGKRE